MWEEVLAGWSKERDAELLRSLADAMADPLRSRILTAVSERPGISVREIAGWVGETNRKVRYHVEALQAQGLLEVQGEARRRGAVERQYRSTTDAILHTDDERLISTSQARRISVEVLKMVMADATGSVASGHFGTREGHAELRIRGEVDVDGWDELSELLIRAAAEAEDIIGRSESRREETDEKGFEITAAMLLFEAPIWNRE
jgi:DNA-binding transcriptional ArsR family regulator